MGTQRGGASSSTRLQPQLVSSSLDLTPGLSSASDVRGTFAEVMKDLGELLKDMTKIINRVEVRAQQGHERLRDKQANPNSQAKCDQVQPARSTDQRLVESLAQATKESEEKDRRMTRKIEHLLNDPDTTYAQTMSTLDRDWTLRLIL